MSKPVLCVFHGNCLDGYTAAWVVRRALGEDMVDFVAGVYQQEPPDVTGRHVVFVDFSYKRAVMEQVVAKAKTVKIIDHHKSAIEDLAGLPGLLPFFDTRMSGALLTWRHYFPTEEPPILLLHVSDRDLWEFKLPRTREINAAMFSYAYTFENWDRIMTYTPQDLAVEGLAIERKHHKDIDELLKVVCRPMVIGGTRVLVANVPYTLGTDAAVKLIAQGQPFGAYCYDVPDGRVFGLRSTDAGPDVSEIAKKYGGGGHRNAAGFRVKVSWVEEV